MKILLVYCNSMQQNALPIGISQIVAMLRQHGMEVVLFDTTYYKYLESSTMEIRFQTLQFRPVEVRYNDGDIYEDFARRVEDEQPDVIGFSVVESTLLLSAKLLERILPLKSRLGFRVAYGGVLAILAPHVIARHCPHVDFICVGEGERTFPQLCLRLERGQDTADMEGFWVKRADGWRKNPLPQLTDVNRLPPLDFSLFGEAYLMKPMMGKYRRTVSIETQRGCPYRCTYCAAPSLRHHARDNGLGSYYRCKTADVIHAELEHYTRKHSPEFLYIIAESFLAVPMKQIHSFRECYSDFKVPFWFNTRPEDITEEKISIMKDLGCTRVSLGIESGNAEFRKKVLKRNTTDEQILRAAQILRDHDVSFSFNLILGYPGETMDMIFDGIKLYRRLRPDGVSNSIFNPYHGTPLREVCIKQGYIDPDLICEDFYQMRYLLRGNTLSEEQVLGMYRTLPLYVYLDESLYPKIEIAKRDTPEGVETFAELSRLFRKAIGWDK